MGEVTTTKSFTVEDITHKPRRMQSDNLKGVASVTTVADQKITQDIPSSFTMESAITFYRENARGEIAGLYKQTVIWLEQLRTLNRAKYDKSGEEDETD